MDEWPSFEGKRWLTGLKVFLIILDKKGTKDSQATVAESVEHPIP
jgi:hypothetical protein